MRTLKVILLLLLSVLVNIPVTAQIKKNVGWLEMIRIYPGDFRIRAKLDTGAKSSSLNAQNLEKFMRDGHVWVKFTFEDKTSKNTPRTVSIEKKVLRSVKIKRKAGGLQERFVVKMHICLGEIFKEIEMNLVDRSHFNYQVLIGRVDLVNSFIVDPAAKFTSEPSCEGQKEKELE